MSDDQLSRYLPRWGDCVAVRAFARQSSSHTGEGGLQGVCQPDVVQKLRMTLEHKRNMRGHRATAFGNKRAEKEKRCVEIGWKACDASGSYHQVRAKNGGGTRHCTVDKSAPMSTLLHTAVDLFFPDGVSPRGPAEDFEFMLQDFAGRLLPTDKTISVMYKESCLKMLRVYLCSRGKMEMVSASQEACTTGTETVCELHVCNVTVCHMQ